jgi:hypothetical protein
VQPTKAGDGVAYVEEEVDEPEMGTNARKSAGALQPLPRAQTSPCRPRNMHGSKHTSFGLSATCTYLRVHCCMSIAHIAQKVLNTRLVNHSVFMRTADSVG